MADPLDGALVRVTVASGTRRVDLALPGAVPVAELVPELARSVGVLDPGTAHAGYALVGLGGRRLAPTLGLGAQEIVDGDLLTIVAGVEVPPPRQYDDPAEALADAVERVTQRWQPEHGRIVLATAGGSFLGLGVGLGMPVVGAGLAVPLAGCLVAVLLGTGLLPRLALALTGVGHGDGNAGRGGNGGLGVAADVAAASVADARFGDRILTGMSIAVGLVVLVVAPTVARLGRWGLALAVLGCVAVALQARHRRGRRQVLAAWVLGVAGVTATAAGVLRVHPAWRPEVAAVLVAVGIGSLAVRMPGSEPTRARLAWIGDIIETAVLLSMPPLLVLASGLLDHLPV